MTQRDFKGHKLLGYGCYSFVYSVTSTRPYDKGKSYALKRYFLRDPAPIYCARKEYKILKKIALDPHASSFLPTLYYSFVIENSPTLVLTEALGLTLYNLVRINGPLTVKQAKFYAAEMICGLKYLHSKGIVHMELKNNNVLITKTGHTLLSDFDRSYDLSENTRPPFPEDFQVNVNYAAPEIANKHVITDRADIWSLGVLMAWLIGKSIRPEAKNYELEVQMAKTGLWQINEFSRLSRSLQEFFNEVFTFNYLERPNIEAIQNLTLFRNINWNNVEQLRIKPPFSTIRLKSIIDKLNTDFNPIDPVLLQCLYSYHMPLVARCTFQFKTDLEGHRSFILVQPNLQLLNNLGIPAQKISEELEKYNFIHPLLNYRRLLSK
ncbi:unnamed protein product [Hymenolepis diminuta]|uniref:Protein kinase domain-containing protein n=1 Tax=Hymenolepis diminuta TaxID=6216 RepID=A0A0R3SSC2_HYMDI|nr:unnamed protein product [Hymenolepis diminuta]VUZ55720.1 unnamed protein product [Hymenolepis diminuta]